MTKWRYDNTDDQTQKHRGRKINKEKFCKKNSLGKGRYGPHIYEDGLCKKCNKVDPRTKRRYS